MSNQLTKNHIIILVLFGMTLIPFLIAFGLKENPELLTGRTNNGQLITPPVVTERSELTGFDKFSADNVGELPGHWLIINVIPTQECNESCLDAIHKARQLQLMMSKDFTRTRRIALLLSDVSPDAANRWWLEDKVLLKMKPGASLAKKIADIRTGNVPDGMLFLMDPLGNLMMQYEPGFDPYKVKSDLTHLLKFSQIG